MIIHIKSTTKMTKPLSSNKKKLNHGRQLINSYYSANISDNKQFIKKEMSSNKN